PGRDARQGAGPDGAAVTDGPFARAELRSYFPTPVAVVELANASAINPPLATAIRQRALTQPSTEHSNLGGWQSSWDLAEWGGPEAHFVLEAAHPLATQLTADRSGQPVAMTWRINAWANLNRLGHGNEFHTHPGSVWSGTYYVDDGGIADDAAL